MTVLSDLRRRMIQAATGKPAHLPSAFSALEAIWAAYQVMKPEDAFILSKGHAALALYAVLEAKGYDVRLSDYGKSLKGHPEATTPGVLFSTGSLGHGLGLAAGYALARKIKGEPGRVFVLLGDGECQEGSVAEAWEIVKELCLNVIALVDDNTTHDYRLELDDVFSATCPCLAENIDKPGPLLFAIISAKGRGCPTFEADPQAWHHRTIGADEAAALIAEVGE